MYYRRQRLRWAWMVVVNGKQRVPADCLDDALLFTMRYKALGYQARIAKNPDSYWEEIL
jgi:hypothetical protein